MQLALLLVLAMAQIPNGVPEAIASDDQAPPPIYASSGEKLTTVFERGLVQPGGLSVMEKSTLGPGEIPDSEKSRGKCTYCYYTPRSYGCYLCTNVTGKLCAMVPYYNGCSEGYESCSGCATDANCWGYCD